MILMMLPDVPGDSKIVGYENWISCTSLSWSLTREFAESSKAGTTDLFTGVSDIQPIEVGKSFDNSSPKLLRYGAGGGSIGGSTGVAEIHLLMSGAGGAGSDIDEPRKQCYLRYYLHNPIIASWSVSGDEDARPTETLTLWYYKIYFQYRQFDGKEWSSSNFDGGWDRQLHKSWMRTPAWT